MFFMRLDAYNVPVQTFIEFEQIVYLSYARAYIY